MGLRFLMGLHVVAFTMGRKNNIVRYAKPTSTIPPYAAGHAQARMLVMAKLLEPEVSAPCAKGAGTSHHPMGGGCFQRRATDALGAPNAVGRVSH